MKNKIFTMLLIGCMCIAAVGCGKKADDTSAVNEAASVAEESSLTAEEIKEQISEKADLPDAKSNDEIDLTVSEDAVIMLEHSDDTDDGFTGSNGVRYTFVETTDSETPIALFTCVDDRGAYYICIGKYIDEHQHGESADEVDFDNFMYGLMTPENYWKLVTSHASQKINVSEAELIETVESKKFMDTVKIEAVTTDYISISSQDGVVTFEPGKYFVNSMSGTGDIVICYKGEKYHMNTDENNDLYETYGNTMAFELKEKADVYVVPSEDFEIASYTFTYSAQ